MISKTIHVLSKTISVCGLFFFLIFMNTYLFSAAGSTSVPLLMTPATAVENSWLGGGAAMGYTIDSTWANPAVAGLQDFAQAQLAHHTLPFSGSAQTAAFIMPLASGTFGGGLRYMGHEPVNYYPTGASTVAATLNSYDMAASALYAVHFSDISIGTRGSVIQSKLADYSATAFSGDIGATIYFDAPSIFSRGKNLNLAFAAFARNLSTGITYSQYTSDLPRIYGGAVYYNLTNFTWLETNLEVFYHSYYNQFDYAGAALEFKPSKFFILRGALRSQQDRDFNTSQTDYAGGASIVVDAAGYRYNISYSIQPDNLDGLKHHLGLTVQLGGGGSYPFDSQNWFNKEQNNTTVTNVDTGDITENNKKVDDKVILSLLRNSIDRFYKSKGRYPRDLNELLLYLNDYHIYEIPNPAEGSYYYNKRSGRVFIRK